MKTFCKRMVALFIVILIVIFILHSKYIMREYKPEQAWDDTVNVKIPACVKVIGYTWKYSDNFGHVSQYFLFEGSHSCLVELAELLKLSASNEDSRHVYPSEITIAGRKLSSYSVNMGFEGSESRNNWLWILDSENLAIYEYNQ